MARITRRGLMAGGAGLAAAGVAGGVALGLGKAGGAIVTPGVSRARGIVGDTALPKAVDVVVVGGGFIGCSTALTLAERGVRVALCEKGVIAGEASGRSLGWVDSQFLDPVKMELIARSKQLWSGMNQRVEGETGHRPLGLTSLLPEKADAEGAEAWLAAVKGMPGVDARLLSTAEIAALQPGASRKWAGAIYQPSDASVEPTLAAPAMAEAARRHGALILQDCAVRGVETKAGRISGVVTEKGLIAAQAVVLAGGVWSPVFARSLGLDLPQFQAHASMTRVAGMSGPRISAWGPGFCWRPQIDGSYTIAAITGVTPITPVTIKNIFRLIPAMKNMWGEVEPVFNLKTFMDQWRIPTSWRMDAPSPFEANRILMPEIRTGLLDKVVASAGEAYPVFQSARRVENWAGVLVSTLDNMPVIGQPSRHPGLYLGTGFYYGLTMGPAVGEALADLVMGNRPRIDLRNYRFERFSDGSPITFRS